MPNERSTTRTEPFQLPATAPRIRITAGMGTLNQKTWVLRRPATLIGTGRQAHIVLPNPEISRAHCLLVNNGSAVVLKDLHSKSGTRCRDTWVDLVTLADGDVLRLGETVLQIAIQAVEQDPGASVAGLVHADPLLLHAPLELRRSDNGEAWKVDQAVVVIGRSQGAAVRLDHPDVSLAHAALFELGDDLAVIDLDSRAGVFVNGEPRAFCVMHKDDRLRIGPFDLALHRQSGVGSALPSHEGTLASCGANPREALESLGGELSRRALDLEQKAERLDRDQRTVESARASIERERSALLRQGAALRETESALESRRRSLEQREKTLRESLLRQAQGALTGVSPFIAAADPTSDFRLIPVAPH